MHWPSIIVAPKASQGGNCRYFCNISPDWLPTCFNSSIHRNFTFRSRLFHFLNVLLGSYFALKYAIICLLVVSNCICPGPISWSTWMTSLTSSRPKCLQVWKSSIYPSMYSFRQTSALSVDVKINWQFEKHWFLNQCFIIGEYFIKC